MLHLSEEIFDTHTPVELRGEWEFYWEKLLTPDDFGGIEQPVPDTFIALPCKWKEINLNGNALPEEGFATLRLVVTGTAGSAQPLALRIGRWTNPLKIYVNGKSVASVGKVGKCRREERYDSRPQVALLPPVGDTVEIIVQTSNYTGKKTACSGTLLLGNDRTLEKQRGASVARYLVAFGAVFVIGMCLLLAYILIQPPYSSLLYLGLTCFTISVRSLFMGESLINDLLPDLPVALKFKIELSLLYLFTIFLNMYCRSLFPRDLKAWYLRVVWIPHALFIAVVLLFDYDTALLTQFPHHVVGAFAGLYVVTVLWRALEIRKKNAAIFMVSISIFFLGVVHDILVYHNLLNHPYVLHYGFLVFIIIQTVLVTYLYSYSHLKFSVLKRQLDVKKRELKQLKTDKVALSEAELKQFCEDYSISAREMEVIVQLAQGLSNNEIAEKLFISFHTVRRHINNVYRKCQVEGRKEFVALLRTRETTTVN